MTKIASARAKLPRTTEGLTVQQEIAMRFQQLIEDHEQDLRDAEEKGLKRGIKRGQKLGVVRSKAAAVVQVLTARGFSPSPAQQAMVTQCSDSAQLTKWLTRAATLDSLDAVFAE
ncbi:MAG: hypothetical protein Q8Q09_00030 [Deltaproteobacteria bacterium]|nr:hypothetical protein [Deltaproteobacteria bacterium]